MVGIILMSLGALLALLLLMLEPCRRGDMDGLVGGVLPLVLYVLGATKVRTVSLMAEGMVTGWSAGRRCAPVILLAWSILGCSPEGPEYRDCYPVQTLGKTQRYAGSLVIGEEAISFRLKDADGVAASFSAGFAPGALKRIESLPPPSRALPGEWQKNPLGVYRVEVIGRETQEDARCGARGAYSRAILIEQIEHVQVIRY
jgi:hypothetical protein